MTNRWVKEIEKIDFKSVEGVRAACEIFVFIGEELDALSESPTFHSPTKVIEYASLLTTLIKLSEKLAAVSDNLRDSAQASWAHDTVITMLADAERNV